jgi:hypothetical protein
MDKSKVAVDLGLIKETLIGMDVIAPMHIRYKATLDSDLDEGLLKKAWDKTKKVYPVIEMVYKLEHGDKEFYMQPGVLDKYSMDHVYLVEAEGGTNDPIKSKAPIEPCTELCGGRMVCISYYDRSVTINAYHTLVDGGGLKMIFSTFLYSYLAMYTGHEDANPIVELTEGRNIDEYYNSVTAEYVFSQEYTPVPLCPLPLYCKGFIDEDMVRDKDGMAYAGNISVSVDEFIKLCKKNGANPSSMLCTILAKAAYELNPERKEDIVFDITLSARQVLGIENSVANAVGIAATYVTYDEITNKSIAEVSQRVRKDLNEQRTRDYFISFRRIFDTYSHTPTYKARTVTYVGEFNVGENNNHIVDFQMETDSIYNLFMMQLNDKFILSIYHGMATEKYMKELIKIFSEFDIKAEVIHQIHSISRDSKTPVL